jgi:sensor histidine kinase YesM
MDINGQLKEYLKIAIVSIVGASVVTYLSCSSCAANTQKFLFTAGLSAVMWFLMWVGNGLMAHYLDIKFLWVKVPVQRLIIGLITTVIYTVAVAFGLLKVYEYAWNMRFNDYWDFIVISLVITFLISLFLHGREFLLQWRQSAVEAERYQRESMVATYESLKSQINPHFLFNSLNALTNLVYEDQDKAVKFIKQLSEVYRYVLETRNQEVVPLKDELKFLKSYIYLQQIRFGDKLSIELSLDGVMSQVAPLALQMLIENAVKHNEVSEENPMLIRIYADNKFICVENNLKKKLQVTETSSGVGLENIVKRYSFLTNEKVVVEETSTHFKVKLPLVN